MFYNIVVVLPGLLKRNREVRNASIPYVVVTTGGFRKNKEEIKYKMLFSI